MPDETSSRSNAAAEQDKSPSPRAFATTTGFIYQAVGLVYLLASGFYWLISGRVQSEAPVRIDSLADYFDPANVLLTITMVNVLGGVAGGMGMVVLGIGLQGERRYSGVGAMIAGGLLAAMWWISAILYIVFGPAWVRVVIVAVCAALNTVLFLLAGHSAAILERHPPPEDQNVVDDAWLEQYARDRHPSNGER